MVVRLPGATTQRIHRNHDLLAQCNEPHRDLSPPPSCPTKVKTIVCTFVSYAAQPVATTIIYTQVVTQELNDAHDHTRHGVLSHGRGL